MYLIPILAQAAENASQVENVPVVPIELIWKHITALSLLEALTFISFGTVCLFYGWRVFKVLVAICFAMLGLAIGVMASEKIGGENTALIAVLSSIAMAIISIPLIHWAVCILGAAAGGLLTAGGWYGFQLPEQYLWAGALVGIVAGGMISFIVFRIAVMLFSSLGGSMLIVTGALALLYLYPETKEQIEQLVFEEKWFLPVMLLVPTVMGIFTQNKFIKSSADWSF